MILQPYFQPYCAARPENVKSHGSSFCIVSSVMYLCSIGPTTAMAGCSVRAHPSQNLMIEPVLSCSFTQRFLFCTLNCSETKCPVHCDVTCTLQLSQLFMHVQGCNGQTSHAPSLCVVLKGLCECRLCLHDKQTHPHRTQIHLPRNCGHPLLPIMCICF